ncbi:nucleoside-diphosphate kinase [Methylobacter luteus]|uniref:nucleoside-diphosphate kinase n=1 Tax=Methylobacter luteus TaxID=415 RepID=UPI000405ABA8|nr:nucleoside-diphosphate kinase [Methylobacter luteus]
MANISNDNDNAISDWLSCFKEKRVIYYHDEYFMRGWSHFLSAFGLEQLLRDYLWNLGLLLAKPEAVESGKGIVIRDFLHNAGYQTLAIERLNIDAEKTHHLWRYAKGRYTDERFQLLVELMGAGPSVLFVVKHSQIDERLPLSIRLTDLKGSTDPRERSGDCLRAVCGGMQSIFLNYIHTSDEPCDVVRELGILLNSEQLQELLCAIKNNEQLAADNDTLDKLKPDAGYTLSDKDCQLRLGAALGLIPAPDVRHKASAALRNCFAGDTESCLLISELLEQRKLGVPHIDRIVLRSRSIAMKREIKSQAFPSCELSHWNEYTANLEKRKKFS